MKSCDGRGYRKFLPKLCSGGSGERNVEGLPGIHGYYWDTPQELAEDEAMGMKFIEPGIPASETALVISLRRGLGSIPKMPMGGPFLSEEEIQEVERWIDAGMPE